MVLSDIVRVVVNFLLLQLKSKQDTLMVLQVTQIAPEVIFVKMEVKFLSPEMALMGHLCVFNALKGNLRAQKRQKNKFF